MNLLLEGGKISEQRVNENFSYTLEKDCSLNQMEYKVMQSQNGTEFVNCMSVLFNGKNQLLYMPGELKTLLSMSRGIDEEDFITIIASLLGCVADIKKNGFLSCQNIEIASDKIYVDPVTYNIRLIYVPIQPKIYEDILHLKMISEWELPELLTRNLICMARKYNNCIMICMTKL